MPAVTITGVSASAIRPSSTFWRETSRKLWPVRKLRPVTEKTSTSSRSSAARITCWGRTSGGDAWSAGASGGVAGARVEDI
jgi:hypothetical protein